MDAPDYPLSKVLDPDRDYPELAVELRYVDRVPLGGQHPHRRFEYALALRALYRKLYTIPWPGPLQVLDVGGAGSPFADIIRSRYVACTVVDPKVSTDLEHHAAAPSSIDAITCISTLEHMAAPLSELLLMHRLLRPGGLLFLTADYWDHDGPDTAHFHWDRLRIYGPASWGALRSTLLAMGFRVFGGAPDDTWHGPHVYDYSFISLALTKEVPDV